MKAEKLTVISETGEKLGNYSKSDAVELARERGLDILQITFDKEPCVAKIIDNGKYKFDQKKKQSLAKKNQKRLEQKEIKMRPQSRILKRNRLPSLYMLHTFKNEFARRSGEIQILKTDRPPSMKLFKMFKTNDCGDKARAKI